MVILSTSNGLGDPGTQLPDPDIVLSGSNIPVTAYYQALSASHIVVMRS